MGVDIRRPNIDAKTPAEIQIKSYLVQLAEQLEWALKNIDTNTTVVQTHTSRSLSPVSESPSIDAKATFGAIKSLIIKSADIVDAYYEEINKKLESSYVASSDYGTFKQRMEQEITTNSEGIEQTFTNLQEISNGIASELGQLDTDINQAKSDLSTEIKSVKDGLESVTYSLAAVSANIRAGRLYDDDNDVPVYGIEIGQRNYIDGVETFNKFARFTADRLSFYDKNGYEVAYISDYKIYITHAEVTGTLKLGGYLVDTTKGITFRWVGRS